MVVVMRETGYEDYSQTQLHSLFSTDKWNELSFDERINACQEVENRYAFENNVAPCTITHEHMDGAAYGWQSGNTICLNTTLVRDGEFETNYLDSEGNICTIKTTALAPSWNTLDTVYHEGTHGIQEASGRMHSTYISPEMDGDLYRIQEIEKEAYAMGQTKTLNALSDVEQSSGKMDPSRGEYIASVKNDSFQSALQDAVQHYNDPDIENTLNSVISNRDNGIILESSSTSYQSINYLCEQNGNNIYTDPSNSEKSALVINQNDNSSINISNSATKTDDGITQTLNNDNGTNSRLEGIDDGINESSINFDFSSTDNSINDGIGFNDTQINSSNSSVEISNE